VLVQGWSAWFREWLLPQGRAAGPGKDCLAGGGDCWLKEGMLAEKKNTDYWTCKGLPGWRKGSWLGQGMFELRKDVGPERCGQAGLLAQGKAFWLRKGYWVMERILEAGKSCWFREGMLKFGKAAG